MPRKAPELPKIEKKPVYGMPERLWRLDDVMAFTGLEREAATDFLKESGVPYFQWKRVYYIHPVAFMLWVEKKLEENTHGQTQEDSDRATAAP